MEIQDYVINLKEDDNWHMHRLHFHEAIEVTLNLSDDGAFFLDQTMYPLRRNTLVVLSSNTLHRTEHTENDGRFRRYVFHILPSLVDKLSTQQTNFFAILREAETCITITDQEAAELVQDFEALRNIGHTGFGADVREKIRLYELLLRICHHVQASHPEAGTDRPDYARVEPILEYIRQIYTEPFKLDEVAKRFSMNKHYLCHIFKKGTGFSVMEYTIQLRIIEAQNLLRGGVSVQEASERTGFQTYEYFIRTFTKYVGISPKQYAKQYLNGDRAANLLAYSADKV